MTRPQPDALPDLPAPDGDTALAVSGVPSGGFDFRRLCAPDGPYPGGLAFVDIETTGEPPSREAITEIAVVEVSDAGVRSWSTLVRPAGNVPAQITALTGIDDAMLADAPRFETIAGELLDRLHERLFVAHNARFDHGHLRAALRRCGFDLPARQLCTVKLSRRLFPDVRGHSLDALIRRHGLTIAARHRALGDADALWQFWQQIHQRFSAFHVAEAVRALTRCASLPPHLPAEQVDRLPDRPGVYLFYGENDLPLYVGKSRRLRTRVLSHFAADHRNDREMKLSQQLRRVDYLETDGELGALLKECELIKTLQPLYNRALRRNRSMASIRLQTQLDGHVGVDVVTLADLRPGSQAALYGVFATRTKAREALKAIAREQQLCPPLLGLERKVDQRRCFAHQLGHCRGACHGGEAIDAHGERIHAALKHLRLRHWPWTHWVGLADGGAIHVIDRWCHLGVARTADELARVLAQGEPAFDHDVYKIVSAAIGRRSCPVLTPDDCVRRLAASSGSGMPAPPDVRPEPPPP